jgi:hypothetical protein
MTITLRSTAKVVGLLINGVEVPARVWEGETAAGIRCHAFISRIGVHEDLDSSEFDRELTATDAPLSADLDWIYDEGSWYSLMTCRVCGFDERTADANTAAWAPGLGNLCIVCAQAAAAVRYWYVVAERCEIENYLALLREAIHGQLIEAVTVQVDVRKGPVH